MQSRRNILTILGLAGVSSSTMSIEKLDTLGLETPPHAPGLMQAGSVAGRASQERIAQALENMAAAIRNGEMTADKVEVLSTATTTEWMHHEVRVHCEVGLPPTA
jgi:hypothetical protein